MNNRNKEEDKDKQDPYVTYKRQYIAPSFHFYKL